MLNFVNVLEKNINSNKKDPSNVQHSKKNLDECNSLHGANHENNSISRVTLSSRIQSRKNSISSCQTDPNPVTTNISGASNQRLQTSMVDQEIFALKNETAELRKQLALSNSCIQKLQHICACIVPYIGAEWSDMKIFMGEVKINEAEEMKSNPKSLMFRQIQLEQDVLMLKQRMENQVDVSNTATGCDLPSASQRFVHQETPMN